MLHGYDEKSEQKNIGKNKSNNQRIFVKECLTKSMQNMTESNEIQNIIRCIKCGIPLQGSNFDFTKKEMKHKICHTCRREQLLNGVLISSYVISAGLFIICIVGVILKKLSINVCLLIGCIEIIFLLFFGRFLEEAVFFGLSKNSKLLSALYRYSVSSEIQNFDVALKYLEKTSTFNDELLKGFLQVSTFQANNLPADWFFLISNQMNISPKLLIKCLSKQIDEANELIYLDNLISKAPPEGISLLNEILLISNNQFGLNKIKDRLTSELANDSISKKWLNEFYTYKTKYVLTFKILNHENLIEKMNSRLENFREPKVPTIDVIESSKNIIQKNPIFRYVFRILLYIALAFLLGFIYRLLE